MTWAHWVGLISQTLCGITDMPVYFPDRAGTHLPTPEELKAEFHTEMVCLPEDGSAIHSLTRPDVD